MDQNKPRNFLVWTGLGGHRYSDGELLKSGFLADVEVHCVETKRVWKVHKVILCSRSDWFKRALTGGWVEAQTGIFKIHDTPEGHVEVLLTFIYTGFVNLNTAFGGGNLWISCMELWKLADFYCLDGLRQLSMTGLDRTALQWARYNAIHVGANKASVIPPQMLDTIVKAIEALYHDDRDDDDFRGAFKSQLLGSAICCIERLSSNAEFQSLLRKTPDLAIDWSLELMSCLGTPGTLSAPVIPPYTTPTCGKCGTQVQPAGFSGYLNILKWIKKREHQMLCRACFPVPTLKELREA